MIKNFINKKNYLKIGKYSFLAGVLFLPSALPIAAIFLLFSVFHSLYKTKFSFLKEKVNLSIIIVIGLILFSTINNFIYQIPKEIEVIENPFLWLNLFNWILSLLCFIAFQNYLKTKKDRLDFSKYFIAGTFPVIASCLFQLIFDINGPFETLNGLIVWFNKPLEDTGGISGLFSNKNYTALWLAVSLPFSLFFLKKNINNKIKSLGTFAFTFIIIYLLISTNSRNAFLGILSTVIIFLGAKGLLLVFFIVMAYLVISTISPLFNLNITFPIPTIFQRFGDISINSSRILIFRSAIYFISQRPFLGWGAGTFYLVYANKGNINGDSLIQHSHNLLLEMAFNFGIPISILITSISLIIFARAIPVIFSSKNSHELFNLDKAWFCSALVVFIMHINDVTFYDGKISLLISILFSGLTCIPLSQKDIDTYHCRNS